MLSFLSHVAKNSNEQIVGEDPRTICALSTRGGLSYHTHPYLNKNRKLQALSFATGIGHNGLLLYCRQLILIFRISNKNSLKYQEYFMIYGFMYTS